MSTIHIRVKGMSCGHCASSIEGGLTQLEGVMRANVDLARKEVTVDYEEGVIHVETINRKIEDMGYGTVSPWTG